MAAAQKERSAKLAERRQELGEQELRTRYSRERERSSPN